MQSGEGDGRRVKGGLGEGSMRSIVFCAEESGEKGEEGGQGGSESPVIALNSVKVSDEYRAPGPCHGSKVTAQRDFVYDHMKKNKTCGRQETEAERKPRKTVNAKGGRTGGDT